MMMMMMSLRLQRGRFKNRSIQTLKGDAVRPTTGRVRQRLFDTLAFLWEGSTGLDAFAGSGAIGFEALSAGAAKVYACEANRAAQRCLHQNAETLGLDAAQFALFSGRLEAFLARGTLTAAQLDWAFFDAPYGYAGLAKVLNHFMAGSFLKPGGFLVVELGRSTDEQSLMEAFSLAHSGVLERYKHLDCGDTQLHLFQHV